MAKDPAFLFYPNDFDAKTKFFSDEQLGKFLRILIAEFQNGRLSEKHMLHICKTYDKEIWDKMQVDDEGLYYNDRLEEEIAKRKSYSLSRRNNAKKEKSSSICKTYGEAYAKHMENENENENVIINNINKVNIENEDLWTTQKNLFLNDFRWNEKFCRDKNVLKIVFDKKILDFVNEIELRNEWKDKKELQRHFVNWFKKNNNNGKSVSEQRMDAAFEYANRYATKGTTGQTD